MLKLLNVKNPHIFLIGTGGTGGFYLESLVRLLADFKRPVTIEAYDGDKVESKNLKRQNFTIDDLDHYKVDVLAKRLVKNVLKAPKIIPHHVYLISDDELETEIALLDDNETPIIIDAVDNTSTRRLINKVVKDLTGVLPVIVLNSGNNDQGGQIVVWSDEKAEHKTITKTTSVVLQSMLDLFPETNVIKDERDENPGLVSICADESESKPQAMMANVLNGNLMASLTLNLIQNKPISHNVYRTNLNTLTVTGFDKFESVN